MSNPLSQSGLDQFWRESSDHARERAAKRYKPPQPGPSLFDVAGIPVDPQPTPTPPPPGALPPVFDAAAGRRAAEAAIDQADGGADVVFKADAVQALYDVCCRVGPEGVFNTDDVWELHYQRGGKTPREGRAMGAIMQHGRREKWCKPSPGDDWTGARRVGNHHRPLRPWRSRIGPPPAPEEPSP